MRSIFRKGITVTTAIFLCCLISMCLCACGYLSPQVERPAAVKGTLDLREWDFNKYGKLKLDGQWEFCYDRLLEPSDFAKSANHKKCGYITVPGPWKDQTVNGVSLPGKGHGTYRLKILRGPDRKTKTICIRCIFSAYKIWINGRHVDSRGNLDKSSKNAENYVFITNKRFHSFTLKEGVNEIVIQVANKDYESGGIDKSILLEDEEKTRQDKSQKHTVNMVVFGILIFAAMYNIMLYFFYKDDTTPLYFGIFCLAMAMKTINHQFSILSYPGNPFFVNYFTLVAALPFLGMFLHKLFPHEFFTPALRFYQVLAAAFIVMLFFADFRTAEQLMKIYFSLMILFIVLCIYVLTRASINRRDDSILFFIGLLPSFLGAICDILYTMWIIDITSFAQYGIIIVCINGSTVVSRRFSRAHHKVSELSRELESNNISLQKLDKFKDQFLASTSHELRTPLHGIIGLSESMIKAEGDSLSQKAHENLSLIASSGHRLTNMVNDLLDMAKIQDEGLSLNIRDIDLYSLSEMVVKLSLPLIGEKPVEIINNIRPDIPGASADEDRIRQVLYNLMGNAIKFTNKGTIELTARVVRRGYEESDDYSDSVIEVSISDTGIGIPDEYKEKIFEPNVQVDGSDSRSYQGAGLGLAIVKQIIELHNGTITAASNGNGGSVFTFTLPASIGPVLDNRDDDIIQNENDTLPTESISGKPGLPAGLSGSEFDNNPVLLVVVDDPVNIRVIQNYFGPMQCVIKTATDGISALDIIEENGSIDLVLLDIMMPAMSGYEVCRRIRTSRSPEDLPVVMLTAKNMMKDIDAAFEAGANDYIVKPFQLSELHTRVGTMLKLKNVQKPAAESITLQGGNRTWSPASSEIIYITSHSKNIVIHTVDNEIEIPVLLKDISHRLPPDMFMRIHKSHIVNIEYIHSMSHVVSGRYRVRLRDEEDTQLPVGPAFLDSLRKKI